MAIHVLTVTTGVNSVEAYLGIEHECSEIYLEN